MDQPGILAIWNDCRPGREPEFERWFQGEHLEERLSVPGFLYGRRHQAISGVSGYFNFYLTQSPVVLTSKAYLERLNDPTPMTRKIMSEVFLNMSRTVCRRTIRRGAFRGAYAVTARFSDMPDPAWLTATIESLMKTEIATAGEIWNAADAVAPVSLEEKLRGSDKRIQSCVMLDTLRQSDAEEIGERISRDYPKAEVGVFRVLCQIGNGNL
jgi:hypothetical protein